MKYRAIFSDFDGTLYSNNFTVSQKDIDAINEYVNLGGKFFISTGRLFQSIYPHLMNMGVNSERVIVAQGAGIYDVKTKQPLYRHDMTLELVKNVSKFIDEQIAKNPNIEAMMYIGDDCFFLNRNYVQVKAFCDLLKIEPHYIDTSLYEYVNRLGKMPTKILAMMNEDQIEPFISEGKLDLKQTAVFCESRKFLVEIMPFGIDKGDSVRRVAESYGIILDDVICIGDSDNDISMIEVAGLGVAVENALDRVKSHAKYIATSCDDSPIADVINKFCLTGEESC